MTIAFAATNESALRREIGLSRGARENHSRGARESQPRGARDCLNCRRARAGYPDVLLLNGSGSLR